MNYTKGEWVSMGGAIECRIGESAWRRIAHAAPIPEPGQFEANGNLLAKAPRMYELLERLLSIGFDTNDENFDEVSLVLDEANKIYRELNKC